MGVRTRETVFVTDATGFLGAALVSHLVARGHEVFALTGSVEAAGTVRRAGATAVMGDLRTPGSWQDEAPADWVFHLAPLSGRARICGPGAEAAARVLASMDCNLFDAVSAGATRGIVYVADIGCYGPTGVRPVLEDEPPQPSPSAEWSLPALDDVEGYVLAGLPIVTAIPGLVYGDGSWFKRLVMDPVLGGRRVLQFWNTGPLVPPIHVRDCIRALVHLVERADRVGRYFVANTEPVRFNDFAITFARVAGRRLRPWRLPAGMLRLAVGSRLPFSLRSDAVVSNIRLRGTGFRFEFSTLEQGLQQILRSQHE